MADAPPVRAEAEVRLWGGTVGALVELESGRVRFEYADAFRGRDLGFGLLGFFAGETVPSARGRSLTARRRTVHS